MKTVSEQQLLECLDLMEQGMSMNDILAQYPEQSDTLRPYLETTAQLSKLAANPTVAQKTRSQDAFLAQAAALKSAPLTRAGGWFWLRRFLFPIAALSMFLILFGFGLVTASASALPGDSLYNIKRQVEGFQLQLASSPNEKLLLIEQFGEERRQEVVALLLAGRTAEVTFDGDLEMMSTDAWIISNIRTEITENTEIAGIPQIGSLVRVSGLTENGRLTVFRIEILTAQPIDLEMIPTATPQPTIAAIETPSSTPFPTETATPTATIRPTNTPSPTATDTPEPTMTNTPTSTETAVPANTPTAPPAPTDTSDDNDNDNDDENENGEDNENDNENEDDNDNGEDNDNDNSEDSEDNDDSNSNE